MTAATIPSILSTMVSSSDEIATMTDSKTALEPTTLVPPHVTAVVLHLCDTRVIVMFLHSVSIQHRIDKWEAPLALQFL